MGELRPGYGVYMGSHIFVKIYDPVYDVANSYKQHDYHPYNGPNNHNAA